MSKGKKNIYTTKVAVEVALSITKTTTINGVKTEDTVKIIRSVSDFNNNHIDWDNKRFGLPNPGDLQGVMAFTEEFRKDFGFAPILVVMNDLLRWLHRGVRNKSGSKHHGAPIIVGIQPVPHPRAFGKSSGSNRVSHNSGRRSLTH